MNNILQVKKIEKKYNTLQGEITAIQNISFNLKEGMFLSIVGSSGCGKSTLLNIISGLDSPTDGEICLCNNSG